MGYSKERKSINLVGSKLGTKTKSVAKKKRKPKVVSKKSRARGRR